MVGILSGESIELHKRVKRCDFCGYFWHDDSLRNTKKTCSDVCKTGIKTLQRRDQREKEALREEANGLKREKKKTLKDDYVWWLEYPYWVNEYSMIKLGWKFEKPFKTSTIDYINFKNATLGSGNRRIPKRIVSYDSKKNENHKINMRLPHDNVNENKMIKPVTTYFLSGDKKV